MIKFAVITLILLVSFGCASVSERPSSLEIVQGPDTEKFVHKGESGATLMSLDLRAKGDDVDVLWFALSFGMTDVPCAKVFRSIEVRDELGRILAKKHLGPRSFVDEEGLSVVYLVGNKFTVKEGQKKMIEIAVDANEITDPSVPDQFTLYVLEVGIRRKGLGLTRVEGSTLLPRRISMVSKN